MKGRVCIFVHKSLKLSSMNLNEVCMGKDYEACALKLECTLSNICLTAIYRAPSGNFSSFIDGLDIIIAKVIH